MPFIAPARSCPAQGFSIFAGNAKKRKADPAAQPAWKKTSAGMLFLINRLLGVTLPPDRKDPSSCFFLSSSGCGLVGAPRALHQLRLQQDHFQNKA